jgi:hypothetical protein
LHDWWIEKRNSLGESRYLLMFIKGTKELNVSVLLLFFSQVWEKLNKKMEFSSSAVEKAFEILFIF